VITSKASIGQCAKSGRGATIGSLQRGSRLADEAGHFISSHPQRVQADKIMGASSANLPHWFRMRSGSRWTGVHWAVQVNVVEVLWCCTCPVQGWVLLVAHRGLPKVGWVDGHQTAVALCVTRAAFTFTEAQVTSRASE
jgi:hypothetical protein